MSTLHDPQASAQPEVTVFDKLDQLESRSRELEAQLADPDIAADGQRYSELAKQHAELAEVVAAYRAWLEAGENLDAATEMLEEASGEDRRLLEIDLTELTAERAALEEQLKLLLVPTDPNDAKDVIVEIRAAAGGDEAGLFAGELRDMYLRYAQSRGWTASTLSTSAQGIGGVKEVILEIAGRDAYAHLKHESGVHRVQRVPATESQGRIHTSTASVAVLPAAEEVEYQLDTNDLRIDVFRSSGPGGQSVNTTDSAVRITHVPTGVVVSCQDEKSQHQNRDKALRILRARLLQAEEERQEQQRADARKGQIGTGDRSEKIRTYNFPQSRITDHRIGFTTHALEEVLGGALDEVVTALRRAEREQRLEEFQDEDPR